MARGEAGPLTLRIQGSVGEVTFRQTRHGLVVQRKPIPTGEPTPAQVQRRAILARAMGSWRSFDQFLNAAIRARAAALDINPTASWSRWYGSAAEKSGQYNWRIATINDGYLIDAIAQDGAAETATISVAREFPSQADTFEILRFNETEGQQTSGWRSYRQFLAVDQTSFTIEVGDGEGRFWILLKHRGIAPNITFGRPTFKDVEG